MNPKIGQEMIGLLLGYGSVGRRHAQLLSQITAALIIVDSQGSARALAAKDYPGAKVVDSLGALGGDEILWDSVLSVIATWGPSHATLFNLLADKGVRRILCEKPLAASVELADQMARRAVHEGISSAVHHYIRYAGFVQALRNFAREQGLGDPVSVVVDGGAACLLTNGIHWVDFASELFGNAPGRVVSTAKGESINPRAPDLGFYGGTAVWFYGDGREAIISFSNKSSIALTSRVYYRNAVVEIDADLNVLIRHREREAVRAFPVVTRTGPAVEKIHEGQLPGVIPWQERMLLALKDVSDARYRVAPLSVGVDSVSACIGALISAREERPIDLPLDPSSAWGREIWPIS